MAVGERTHSRVACVHAAPGPTTNVPGPGPITVLPSIETVVAVASNATSNRAGVMANPSVAMVP